MFAQVASFTYAALHLAAPPFSLTTIELGSIFTVFLIGVVVTPLAGRAIFRFGRRPTFIAACFLSWSGLVICLPPSTLAIVAGLACCSTGIFAGQACATSYAAIAARTAKSSGVGLYLTTYYLGGSVGAVLPAPIFLQWGWIGCIALISIVLAIGFVAALRIWSVEQGDPKIGTDE